MPRVHGLCLADAQGKTVIEETCCETALTVNFLMQENSRLTVNRCHYKSHTSSLIVCRT